MALTCCGNIAAGIPRGCRDNTGGLRRVLIANFCDVQDVTHSATAPIGQITNITMNTGTQFFEFVPSKNSSNIVENIQANSTNGTLGYEQVATLLFAKNEQEKRNIVYDLSSSDVMLIGEDYNGKFWLYGEENGMELTGGNSATGTALSDMNGWSLTLTALEHDPSDEVDAAIIPSLLTPAP